MESTVKVKSENIERNNAKVERKQTDKVKLENRETK